MAASNDGGRLGELEARLAALRARMEAGDAVFDDHWTRAGHETIARFLAGDGVKLTNLLHPRGR